MKTLILALLLVLALPAAADASVLSFISGNGVKAHHNKWYRNDGSQAHMGSEPAPEDDHHGDKHRHHDRHHESKDDRDMRLFDEHLARRKHDDCKRAHLTYIMRHPVDKPGRLRGLTGCLLWQTDANYHSIDPTRGAILPDGGTDPLGLVESIINDLAHLSATN